MKMVECDQANVEGKIRKENDEIYFPNWLLEVLAWISRVEMANSALSTASRTFNALCWPKLHGNVKQYCFYPDFLIGHKIDARGNVVAITKMEEYRSRSPKRIMKMVPIADSPMPDYITDFGKIELRYLDGQILAFIERIVQRYGRIEVNFNYDNLLHELLPNVAESMQLSRTALLMNTDNKPIRQLMNVLMANDKIITLGFLTSDRNLDLMEVFTKLFCSDTDNKAVEQPQQKVFRLKENRESEFIEYLKNDFSNATQPVNLFIHPVEMHAKFTLENAHYGETLQLYHKRDMLGRFMYNYLIRHPSGQGAYWKHEGEKKIMQSWMKFHSTRICINIDKIGDF